jgi:thioredoxin 1
MPCPLSGHEDLAKEYEGRIKFVMIEIDKEHELADKYHILLLTAVLIFKDSEPMEKLLGFHERWATGGFAGQADSQERHIALRGEFYGTRDRGS